jgi:HSP20 family protein
MNALAKRSPLQSLQIGRIDPFREIANIERRLESLFERTPLQSWRDEAMFLSDWAPQVDIFEDEKEFTVKADLPEVSKADVKVSFHEGLLEISGERKSQSEESGRRFHRSERCYGTFLRSFTLPTSAEGEKAKAEFNQGVLTVRIPKNKEGAARTIDVKVS